jgi:hypothetical protein
MKENDRINAPRLEREWSILEEEDELAKGKPFTKRTDGVK